MIGVFAFGPSDMLTKSQAKLRQLLFSINKTVNHKPASYFEDLSHSRILLQICSATKKYPSNVKLTRKIKASGKEACSKLPNFIDLSGNVKYCKIPIMSPPKNKPLPPLKNKPPQISDTHVLPIIEALLRGVNACPPSEFEILSCRNFGRSSHRCWNFFHCHSRNKKNSYVLLAMPKF